MYNLFCAKLVAVASVAGVVLLPTAAGAQIARSSKEPENGFTAAVNKCAANSPIRDQQVIDGYTRLEFSSDRTVPVGVDYGKELRHPITRFFSGKSVTRALTLDVTYSRHKVDAKATVVSFSHKSSRKGYEWTSEVSNQRLITPYFRIDHDGIVKTSWKLALNKTYDTSALQDLLDVVKRATKLISPASGLLTTVNADRFKDTSQFIDQSFASFLKESVDEIAPDEFPLAACVGQDLVALTLELPTGGDVIRNNPQPKSVGTWTVRLAPAIRSIFAPAQPSVSAQSIVSNIGAGTVFDFQVADKLSLGQYLGGDNSISAVRDEFKASGNQAEVTAAKLCALLVGRLQGIGLNRFDTAVAVRAFAEQMLSNNTHRTAILNTANCPILIDPV